MKLSFLLAGAALVACATSAPAQTAIASAVAKAPDGMVRLSYPSRPGVCGNGSDMVAFRNAMFARNFEGTGTWTGTRCVAGPVHVALTVSGGRVTALQTRVGGTWPNVDVRVTDLGTVTAHDAAAYFFSVVPALEQQVSRGRLLLPAVLADEPQVIAPLLAIARDQARTPESRRQALMWLGNLGDASIAPVLAGFARQEPDGEKRSLASTAIAALAALEDGSGIPAMLELSNDRGVSTRRETAFWLGQSGDQRATNRLHEMIEDEREEPKVRAHAIFSLSHGDHSRISQFSYLRDVFTKLGRDDLKEAVIQGMGQEDDQGSRWLIARALDGSESVRLRKSALFWAGQREETSTGDLVSVYRDGRDTALREHALFVLAQRQDDAAMEALMKIARGEDDSRMRGKALFWLAQKHDPRVTRLIADLVTR